MENKFFTKKEIADFLGVTVYTIDRYVRDREMPYYHVGTEPRFLPAGFRKLKYQDKSEIYSFSK